MTDEARVRLDRGRIYLSFPYSERAIAAVRGICDRWNVVKPFNPKTREWSLPISSAVDVYENFVGLDSPPEFGDHVVRISEELLEQKRRDAELEKLVLAVLNDRNSWLPKTPKLYAHQETGVEWLCKRRFAILADDMGLGKTIQSLLAAKIMRAASGAATVVIVPANKITDWSDESSLVGLKPFVYSWAKLPDALKLPKPFTLIVDEAHYGQSLRAKRTQAMLDIAKRADSVFLLTATPMRGRKPINLYPLLCAIRHPISVGRSKYEKRYCDAKPGRFAAWDTGGRSNLMELHQHVAPYLLKRLKSECLDLPLKTRVHHECEISPESLAAFNRVFDEQKREYSRRKQERIDELKRKAVEEQWTRGQLEVAISRQNMADATVALNRIRQSASIGKVATAVELANDVIEDGGQCIVFTSFRLSAIEIAKEFKVRPFIGGVLPSDQDRIKADFQSGKDKVIVGTIDCLGTGHNLQRANTVVMVDRPFTPGDVNQAEDRAYRIGTVWPVTSYWLRGFRVCIAVDELLESKRSTIATVIDGAEEQDTISTSLSPDNILGLIFRD